MRLPAADAYAANAVGVAPDALVIAAGHPRARAALAAEGFRVLEVDLAEFALADGSATCLSLFL